MVTTAGRSTSSVSRPASTSRVTFAAGLAELELRSERGLGTIPQCGQHLAGLVVVVVDGLFAEDDEEGLLASRPASATRVRTGQRLERRVGDDVQRALRAHGERIAQRGLAVGGPDGGDDHFIGAAALLDAQRFFDRDLIEGIDAELDAVEHHARAVGLHADAYVVVDDAFDCDENSSGILSGFHERRV